MPRSKPETHPCEKHPAQTETWVWKWGKGGSIESSEPECLSACPLCDDERLAEEADEFEEMGEAQAARILRRELAERRASR